MIAYTEEVKTNIINNLPTVEGNMRSALTPLPIICCWYTPDYSLWAEQLEEDAEKLDLPIDTLKVIEKDGPWEAITRFKPLAVKHFMRKYPDSTLILVDADARLRGTREEIIALANINTDIAMRFSGKISKSRGTTKMHPWSGTMVFQPTENARQLVDHWHEAGIDAPKYATDEATLGRALCEVPGLTLSMLPNRACAGAGEQNPIISHPHRTGKRSRFIRIRSLLYRIIEV